MRKNIKHFVRICSKCQLIVQFKNVKKNIMHFSKTWFDKSQSFERWSFDLIKSLFVTINENKWIVIVINYAIKWFVTRVIFETIFEILTNFVINDIYRDYEISKKIIIDRNVNLWAFVMIKTFALFEIKHKNIIFYHSKTNEIVKRFNNVLSHMLIKYCIENFIKKWNIYLN